MSGVAEVLAGHKSKNNRKGVMYLALEITGIYWRLAHLPLGI